MPIGTEPEMNQVEYEMWRTAFTLERLRVLGGGAVEIPGFDRHRKYLLGTQRGVFKQTFLEMSQVAIGVTRGGYTLVDLEHPYRRPRNLLGGQRTQHHPWSMAAAHGEQKSAARF